MKIIIIAYWKERNLVSGLTHNQVIDYSIEKQNEIVQAIIDAGCSAMLRPNTINPDNKDNRDTLLIWIDKGRFGQS